MTSNPKTIAESFKKLTQREHILQLPDSYIGSRDSHRESRWIWSPDAAKMEWREVSFNPGFFKIFDELVVNALDQVTRMAAAAADKRVSRLVITLTPTQFVIHNDGESIPVSVHPEYKVMVPELIFGHLLTSSNYDEGEEKVVGGKNGYGAKLTNIYSREFVVRVGDGKIHYEQTFSDNMSIVGKPVMKKGAKSYVEIAATPDLPRFFGADVTEIPADMLDVLRTRVVDAAALASANGCKVFLASAVGGAATLVPVSSFEKYVRLFTDAADVPVFYERAGPRWEIAAVLTRHLHSDTSASGVPDDRHISFVNGIFTRRGGKHVEAVARSVLGAFCEGPGKKLDLKPAQLKDAVTFFVNATIVNPSFDSQTKETLTTPAAKFGSKFEISDKFVTRLAKEGGLLEEAQAVLDAKLSRAAKKVDGRRTTNVRGIPKLDDAEWAGGPHSSECTLILTEGDSAASMALAGLKEAGRKCYGVFPLRGKLLNVRDATIKEKTANKEITHLKRIIGLEHGKSYKDIKKLRYGRVMIMTDQDVDGSHIKGLLVNLFHSEWPELLDMGFLCCLMTPLLKATKGAITKCFYSASEYEKWVSGHGVTSSAAASIVATSSAAAGEAKGWHLKYYKGLGTSTAAEAREYFRDMTLVRFVWDAKSGEYIDMAFNEKRADDRKEWLDTYSRTRVLDVPTGGKDVTYTNFINDELIHFSIADNFRSIPHVMDGLKPSQRKILWAARKRNLVSEIKVAQLAGYVSENAAYHHGEKSLMDAIIGMAQEFVGSNNINLLAPNGQFGTRLEGGKDSAAPRYIFTALEPIQGTLLSKADDPGLTWLEDDGLQVEPEYYMPVLPLLLINGSDGIGTGYSSKVLSYSPRDLVTALRGRLTGVTKDLTETALVPWYDGFRGSVIADGKKVTTRGVYEFFDDEGCRVRITELPVGTWTKRYKEFLEKMLEGSAAEPKVTKAKKTAAEGSVGSAISGPKLLRDYQESNTDTDVCFVLTLEAEYYHEARTFPLEFEKKFKLVKQTSLTNMVAFDVDGRLRRFASAGEILETFYGTRLGGYVSRKANELARLEAQRVELDARVRFVRAVVAGTLVVANAADAALLAGLKALALPPLSAPEAGDDLRGYEYLLRMRVDRLKAAAILELEASLAEIVAEAAILASKSAEDLWLADLAAFEVAYEKFGVKRLAARSSVGEVKKTAAPKKRVPKKV